MFSFICQFLTRVISKSVMKLQESVDTTDLKVGSLSRLNHVFFYFSVFDQSDQPVCDETVTRVISQSMMKLRESVNTTDLKAGSLSPLNHVFFYLSVFDPSDQPVCDEAARIC